MLNARRRCSARVPSGASFRFALLQSLERLHFFGFFFGKLLVGCFFGGLVGFLGLAVLLVRARRLLARALLLFFRRALLVFRGSLLLLLGSLLWRSRGGLLARFSRLPRFGFRRSFGRGFALLRGGFACFFFSAS